MSDYPINTPNMLTIKERFIGSNCKIFFPFNEASGDVVTDVAGGVVLDKAGALFTTAHAIKQIWADGNRTDSEVISSESDKHITVFVVAKVDIAASALSFTLGAGATFSISITGTTSAINSSEGAATSVAFDTIGAGDTVLLALSFNKDTGNLRAFNGINGAVVKFAEDDASIHLPAIANLPNTITLGVGLAQFYMGAGYFLFDDMPTDSEMVAMLEVTRQNIISGKNYFDSRLSNY